jgi:outer membrane receptor protein involved in Fe transport
LIINNVTVLDRPNFAGYLLVKYIIPLIIILFVLADCAMAQKRRSMGGGGSISGRVVDSETQKPVEYATIILFSVRDSSQISGIVSDDNGIFFLNRIRPGRYYIQISFMGFEVNKIDDIRISQDNLKVDLGDIKLVSKTVQIRGVEVTAERQALEFKIDKKIINVAKFHTAASGTAVDVLENVPSVEVDLEGNVSLRGSSNFTVLIDNRPTVLDANDALEQIPASMIENIEIITNPSAKFDPDGDSGIINIIMKKGKISGFSGVINSNGGPDDRYGGDFLLNYRNSFYNAFINVDYNKRFNPGRSSSEGWTTFDTITTFVHSEGNSNRGRTSYGIRCGVDLTLSQHDNLGIGFRYGHREMERSSKLDHDEWSNDDFVHSYNTSDNKTERGGDFYAINLDYLHKFNGDNHSFNSQVIFSRRDMDEMAISELVAIGDDITSGQITTESGPAARWRIKLDYTRPLFKNGKLELGYQSRLGKADEINEQFEYDTINEMYVLMPQFGNATEYHRDIHSLYALLGGEYRRLGYQAGIRGEYTFRDISVINSKENFNIDRWDYFPSLHISYRLDKEQQLMASYARKIRRTRGWWLEPFITWSDAYNVRQGNPDLDPEFVDSYEVGYQKSFGRNLLSAELYYRITHNKVEFVRSVYAENVTLSSVENIGTDYSFGAEIMLSLKPADLWNMNLIGNLFNYRVEGELYGSSFDSDDFNWSARINNTLNITQNTRFQLNGRYMSESVTSQGSRDDYLTVNLALKHDFISRIFSATLQVNDIFNSAKREFVSSGVDFYSYSRGDQKAPIVMLNLSYNFNNYKQERQRDGNGEDMGEDDF